MWNWSQMVVWKGISPCQRKVHIRQQLCHKKQWLGFSNCIHVLHEQVKVKELSTAFMTKFNWTLLILLWFALNLTAVYKEYQTEQIIMTLQFWHQNYDVALRQVFCRQHYSMNNPLIFFFSFHFTVAIWNSLYLYPCWENPHCLRMVFGSLALKANEPI